MSKKEFGKWVLEVSEPEIIVDDGPTRFARHAWEAGAEYMRQECMKLVYGMCESDNVAARTVEAIRKIEA